MRLTLSLILLLLSLLSSQAQVTPAPLGSTVKGFVLPQRNAEGKLEANITGDTAKVVSVNRTEIYGLKIQLYEGDTVMTTITAPRSDLWTLENRLTGRDGVRVERGDLEITAQMVEWEPKQQRAILRKEVRVVIKEMDFGATQKP
jgi:hypothetical protein